MTIRELQALLAVYNPDTRVVIMLDGNVTRDTCARVGHDMHGTPSIIITRHTSED